MKNKNSRKIKSYFNKLLIGIMIGLFTSLLSVFILQYFHFQMNLEAVFVFFDNNISLLLLSSMIIFLLFLSVFFLLGNSWIASFSLIMLSLFLGIATQQKSYYRGEPLYPSDIYFIKDFSFLTEMVSIRVLIFMIFILFTIVAGIGFYLVRQHINKTVNKKEIYFRFIGLGIVLSTLVYVSQFNQPNNKIKKAFSKHVSWVDYSQEKNYTDNGVVSGILFNLRAPAINEPEGYNKGKIKELYKKYSTIAEKVNENRDGFLEDVNVLYVMNESFSDPYQVKGIEVSGGDALVKYRESASMQISGQVLSPVYGGGTANVEFEALTSISNEPLAGSITSPFIQLDYQMEEMPSILQFMKKTKHELTGIHPHNTTMYKRVQNYKSLGFTRRIFLKDLKYTNLIDDNYYISDESAYQEMWDVLETTKGKDFIHLLTIQNHKPFSGKYNDVQYQVDGALDNFEIEHYLKGMEYSDDALAQLLDKVDNYSEKIIVVFWGDHLPPIYDEDLYQKNGHLLMHQTPLLFYTNFQEYKKDLGTLSPIYFLNHILSMTNEKITPFVALLMQMEEELPAFEKKFYMERETGVKESREELLESTQELLNDYDMILYDITTGKNYSKQLGLY